MAADRWRSEWGGCRCWHRAGGWPRALPRPARVLTAAAAPGRCTASARPSPEPRHSHRRSTGRKVAGLWHTYRHRHRLCSDPATIMRQLISSAFCCFFMFLNIYCGYKIEHLQLHKNQSKITRVYVQKYSHYVFQRPLYQICKWSTFDSTHRTNICTRHIRGQWVLTPCANTLTPRASHLVHIPHPPPLLPPLIVSQAVASFLQTARSTLTPQH